MKVVILVVLFLIICPFFVYVFSKVQMAGWLKVLEDHHITKEIKNKGDKYNGTEKG